MTTMILEEFDLNRHINSEKEESYAEGIIEGEKRFVALTQKLLTDSGNENIEKAATDFKYCKA